MREWTKPTPVFFNRYHIPKRIYSPINFFPREISGGVINFGMHGLSRSSFTRKNRLKYFNWGIQKTINQDMELISKKNRKTNNSLMLWIIRLFKIINQNFNFALVIFTFGLIFLIEIITKKFNFIGIGEGR